ncbi:MAG TPA: hypothetical protein PKZ35_17690, partial [Gammaproteobacteria bacterium]|nr:hypothetical protein [Gammaproteobacteria bacterium]
PIADGRVPQRRFWTEERREVGAQRRPSLGVPFLLPAFLWASKEKQGECAPPRAFKNRFPSSSAQTTLRQKRKKQPGGCLFRIPGAGPECIG